MARNITETKEWITEPVVGQRVQVRLTGTDGRRTWGGVSEGVYEGVLPSQHTGEPMHMFRDGHMNGTPQGHFGFPVADTRLSD